MHIDVANVKNSFSSALSWQMAPLVFAIVAQKPTMEPLGRRVDVATKREIRFGSFFGMPASHVDYTISIDGDIALVDKLANLATTSTGDSVPPTTTGGLVKIRLPTRYLGKR